jgi:acyl-CoA synthetase (NDP forming)
MGLEVPRLSDETERRLRKILPPAGTSVGNPVDLTLASLVAPEVYRGVIDTLADDEGIDLLLVIGAGGRNFPQIVSDVAAKIRKPLVVASMMPPEAFFEESRILMGNGIPLYPDPRRAARALAGLARYSAFRRGQI